MIYGLSLLIGITGATDIYAIGEAITAGTDQPLIFTLSVLMIIAGFGFKVAIVPFHFWAPDVYEGAPTAVAGFLAVASKLAAFALMIRFFTVSLSTETSPGIWEALAGTNWNVLIAVTAILAMVIGNLTALRQNNIKRMLAYSSIAHAGYILMGLVVMTSEGVAGIMIYAFIYLFMNLGAFLVVILVHNSLGTENISDYKGLGQRAPFLSICMTIFLVALTGFPPTAGFIAKIYIFGAAINAGWFWLVLIAGLTTIISLFYYMRVVRNMFLYEPEGESSKIVLDKGSGALLLLLVIPTPLFGVYFSPIIEFARSSIAIFGF
jgi:NADH-quinone oxidoreductase subunit N